MSSICIVGLGHIGGSIALEIKARSLFEQVLGVDKNEEHCALAVKRQLVDQVVSLEQGIKESQLVVLATPVNALLELLPLVLDKIEDQTVLDLGSTKWSLAQAVEGHVKRQQYVACHPMAGRENSGPEAAILHLFDGNCVVICDRELSGPSSLQSAEQLFTQIGMQLIYLDSESHDVHAAYVSHISHISSFALALTVLEKERDEKRIFELASGGFGSTVRLAKSSPNMWIPIFQQNRDNVLDVLDEHINTLAKFRSLLIKKDFTAFHTLIEQANHIRKILK